MLRRHAVGAAIAVSLILAALAAQAGKHPIPDASQFTPGVSTADDVIGLYGRPNIDTQNSDGSRVIAYTRIKTHVKAVTWVPVVGMFAGGASAQTDSAAFTFGTDGKLRSTTSGNSAVDCGTMPGSCH